MPTPSSNALRSLTRKIGPLGVAGGVAAGLALAALVLALWTLVPTLLSPAVRPPSGLEQRQDRLKQFAEAFEGQLKNIGGRSLFALPPRPTPPRRAGPVAPPSDAKPSSYGGPAIIAITGFGVLFEDGRLLRQGNAANEGLRVVSINPPWGARLEWRGAEFDVPLFERTTPEFLVKPEASASKDK
ncbi:MAG: hypothetical protein IBJ11_04945 [Phycisphaerales bacterium]|nr:hypothetical protein [Phycisphaerales bacterium]